MSLPVLALFLAASCSESPESCTDLVQWTGGSGDQCSDQVSLTIVYDNNAYDSRLQTDWGFACWIQYGDRIVLFDTGADGDILLSNMGELGLDPAAIEVVVLSHIHGDHTGGMQKLLETGVRPDVYVPVTFPTSYKNELRKLVTVFEVHEAEEILPGIHTTGKLGLSIPEQGLILKSNQGLVLITGCAHPGIVEMVRRTKDVSRGDICLVVGGFHLGAATSAEVRRICATFRELGVVNVAPCHCTGEASMAVFAEEYGDRYLTAGVGWGIGMCP